MLTLLRRLVFFALFLLVAAFIGREILLKQALQIATEKSTGFPLKIESLDFNHFLPPLLYAYNLKLENPSDFEVPEGLNVSKVEARFDKDFWGKLQTPQIARLTLEIKEFVIVRNTTGRINVEVMDAQAKTNPGRIPPVPLIRELVFSVEKVSFYDCKEMGDNFTKPDPTTLQVNLKDLHYKNIQNVAQLERLIIRETLQHARFKQLVEAYQAMGISSPTR